MHESQSAAHSVEEREGDTSSHLSNTSIDSFSFPALINSSNLIPRQLKQFLLPFARRYQRSCGTYGSR